MRAEELPGPVHDPEDVRRIAEEVLADPRYREPPESLVEAFQRWVGERIGDLLSALAGTGGGTVVAWLILLAAAAVIVVALTRYGRGVRLDREPAPAARGAMVELTRTPEEWRAEAAALEAAGRFREALRCRHRALVGELVALGAVPEIPGRTAREHVADVAVEMPAAAPAVAAATDLFEGAWYGDAPVGQADAARMAALEAEALGRRPDRAAAGAGAGAGAGPA